MRVDWDALRPALEIVAGTSVEAPAQRILREFLRTYLRIHLAREAAKIDCDMRDCFVCGAPVVMHRRHRALSPICQKCLSIIG